MIGQQLWRETKHFFIKKTTKMWHAGQRRQQAGRFFLYFNVF